jgi:hypothetical protein
VPILRIIAGGIIAGILANATGYLITGRLFHPFQAKTPDTWRRTESWTHYQYATAIRIAACIGIALLYAALGTTLGAPGASAMVSGASFGTLLWAVTILPLVLEVGLFVNWHRGFIIGLVIDWLVVCVLASVAAAVAIGAVRPIA